MAALAIAAMVAFGANPPTGQAANDTVEVNALFMDTAAVQQATGSDFKSSYTVIEVTVIPKGDKPLDVQPDDFLLRINSSNDSSGPMAASQIYGAGSALVLHGSNETIGITRNDPGYSGVSVVEGSPYGVARGDQGAAEQDAAGENYEGSRYRPTVFSHSEKEGERTGFGLHHAERQATHQLQIDPRRHNSSICCGC